MITDIFIGSKKCRLSALFSTPFHSPSLDHLSPLPCPVPLQIQIIAVARVSVSKANTALNITHNSLFVVLHLPDKTQSP